MSKLDELIASIDEDLGWRKKEVSNLIMIYEDSNNDVILKSLILLLYSHWEGYIKNISKLYLKYVSDKSINISDLTKNYIAISLKGKINEIYASKETLTMMNELSFIDSISEDSGKKFKLKRKFISYEKDKSIINTNDNLNYKVFTSILNIIGIGNRECLSTKEIFIDEKLLNNRNKIAHGNKIDASEDDFDFDIDSIKIIKNLVFIIMDSIAGDLKYYAENEFYLSKNIILSEQYNENSNMQLKKELEISLD